MGRDYKLTGATAMNSRAICFTLFSTIAIAIAASLPAQAQRARVFVSVTGNDANPCTAGSPCKTFQAAHDAVLAGGEISVLDTGGYGTLIINKAVSIVAVGVEASIAIPSGGTGITINALSTDKVALRGLTIDGGGVGFGGISFNSGQSLTIDDCVVRGTTNDGFDFRSEATTPQTLTVSNSRFYDTGRIGLAVIAFSSGATSVSIDRTRFSGNASAGLDVDGSFGTGPLTATVTDSVSANNGNRGILVGTITGHSPVNVSLTRTQVLGNSTGLELNGSPVTVWVAQSTISGNTTTGYSAVNGAVLNSYSNNFLAAANGPPGAVLGSASPQ